MNPPKIPSPDFQRSNAFSISAKNLSAHAREGIDHPLHRPLAQRSVPIQSSHKGATGQDSGKQAHSCSRIAAINGFTRRAKPIPTLPLYKQRLPFLPHFYAESLEGLHGAKIIFPSREIPYPAPTMGNAGENNRSMADRFVSRNGQFPVQRPLCLLNPFHLPSAKRSASALHWPGQILAPAGFPSR